MSFVKWDDKLLVGIKEIDEQHQNLFRIVNDLYEEIMACQTLEEEAAITLKFMEQFQQYATIHFAAEELMLAEKHYESLVEHKEEHNDFICQLQRLRQSHIAGEQALSFDVFKFVSYWIAEHIKVSDQKYAACLK